MESQSLITRSTNFCIRGNYYTIDGDGESNGRDPRPSGFQRQKSRRTEIVQFAYAWLVSAVEYDI